MTKEQMVTVTLPLSEAQKIRDGLSDIACWCRGFNSALAPDDHDRQPFGAWAVTEANIHFKSAIDKPESVTDIVDDALCIVMQMAFKVSTAAKDANDLKGHAAAAYIHDQIVNTKLKLKGSGPLAASAPWPFDDELSRAGL